LKILAWPAFENKTGNPYNRLLYESVEEQGVEVEEFTLQRALRGDYDLWHLHWPDDFLSYPSPAKAVLYVAAQLSLTALARQRGTRVVWTIHDLGPHESPHPWLESIFWRLFPRMVDGFITLSEIGRDAALRRFPTLRSVPGAVVPHGHYRPAYPDPVPKAEAREELGLDAEAPVAVYVGRIRPYKSVEPLVHAFRSVPDDDARLLVTGNPAGPAIERQIRRAAEGDDRIDLDLRFIPDDRIPVVLGAADLVVLPYEDILHSGSALLALSFHRPVLVPNRGAMSELQADVGADWVHTYDGRLTPDDLTGALSWARTTDRPDRAPLDDLEWDALAEQTVALYDRVLDG
jgi:glycosyltransferase involved in cell wall biosynthesis